MSLAHESAWFMTPLAVLTMLINYQGIFFSFENLVLGYFSYLNEDKALGTVVVVSHDLLVVGGSVRAVCVGIRRCRVGELPGTLFEDQSCPLGNELAPLEEEVIDSARPLGRQCLGLRSRQLRLELFCFV